MSHNSLLVPCPDIQDSLDTYYNTCNSSRLREPTPFFDFLNSDMNNFGLSQRVAPGNGKVKTIQLLYRQRLLESEVTERASCNNICTATTERGDLATTCTIDPCEGIHAEELMDIRQWADVCRDNGTIFVEILQSLIDVVMRRLATDITTEASALIGNWNTNVQGVTDDCLLVPTYNFGGTALSSVGVEALDLAKMQTGYCQPAALFGGTKGFTYMRKILAGCCSNEGIDLSELFRLYGTAYLYDKRVATAAGGNEFAWLLQPGSLALIHYNQYEGTGNAAAVSGQPTAGNYWSGVINDPKTGFPLDLLISDNCGKISVIVEANAKLCSLPNDLFNASDEMTGVNFFNCVEFGNCETDPCT